LTLALESDSFRLRLRALTAIARIDDGETRAILGSISQSHADAKTREAAGRLLEVPARNLLREYRREVNEERREQHRILHAD